MRRFGRRLRTWRMAVGLTQTTLGAAVGRSQSAVSGWENGAANPKRQDVAALSAALGVPVADLEAALVEDAEARAAGYEPVSPLDLEERLDALELAADRILGRLDQMEAALRSIADGQ